MTSASLIHSSAGILEPFGGSYGRSGFNRPEAALSSGRAGIWGNEFAQTPPADVWHMEDAFVIEVDLPGLTKDDIHISVENNVLTIAGGRSLDERHRYDRVERWRGRILRSFALSNKVDASNVDARFENGVLRLELRRSEDAKPRRIAIH